MKLWPLVNTGSSVVNKLTTPKQGIGSSLMAQQVKDLLLPQLWHKLQLWHRFDPWPGNFHMPVVAKKKKKKGKMLIEEGDGGGGVRDLTVLSVSFFY